MSSPLSERVASRALTLADQAGVSELTKVLAISVLHFHSTPWLHNQWQSQDGMFFGNGESLGLPHLRSRVRTRKNVMISPSVTAPVTRAGSIDASEATSRTLYCLGVVLLDLVYEARLEDL